MFVINRGFTLAKKRKDPQQKDLYQRRFEDKDFAWLAEQFDKQAAQNPDLTLEEYAIRHGIEPKWIRSFINVGWNTEFKNVITVWHGTTIDRAKAIMIEGFKAPRGRARKKIWFTQKSSEAHRRAGHLAQSRGKAPVVFRCQINISKYSEFDNPRPHHYAFKHSYIDKTVISSVDGMEVDKEDKRPQEKIDKAELVDVIITRTSGKYGVLLWINAYLEGIGQTPIDENHPAIEKIYQWIEAQYTGDREEAISEEEMLVQVKIHLNGEPQKMTNLGIANLDTNEVGDKGGGEN